MVHVLEVFLVENRRSHVQFHFEKLEEVVRMHHNVPVDNRQYTILKSIGHRFAIGAIGNSAKIFHDNVKHLL